LSTNSASRSLIRALTPLDIPLVIEAPSLILSPASRVERKEKKRKQS
jgi:hypothetical protein